MPCFKPRQGWRSHTPNPDTGKRPIIFSYKEAIRDAFPRPLEPQITPCGQCRYCRSAKMTDNGQRCFHEASLHERNCFITLTYDPENLPTGYHTAIPDPLNPKLSTWVYTHAPGSIDPRDPVEFMKRLRAKFGPNIRAYGCAEYGKKGDRPHYHILLFNFDFDDKLLLKMSHENPLYTSDQLQKLWAKGHCTVGSVTIESANYTAKYATKRITGEAAQAHYQRTDPETGLLYTVLPERPVCVSKRPAIGKQWYEKNGKYLRDHDQVIIQGKKKKPARYYDRLFDIVDPAAFGLIKERRRDSGELATSLLRAEDARNRATVSPLSKTSERPLPRLKVMEKHAELSANNATKGSYE